MDDDFNDRNSHIIKDLQEAYKEYEEVKKELKKQGKLEDSIQDNKANLSAKSPEAQ